MSCPSCGSTSRSTRLGPCATSLNEGHAWHARVPHTEAELRTMPKGRLLSLAYALGIEYPEYSNKPDLIDRVLAAEGSDS